MDDSVDVVRVVAAVVFGLIGAVSLVGNFGVLWILLVQKKYASLVPFMGGLGLALAIFLVPLHKPAWLALLPLLIDPGCSFYLLHWVVLLARKVRR